MARAFYNGHETLTFSDYIDQDTGKTLTAAPRAEPYDVALASGRVGPDLPPGWFVPADEGWVPAYLTEPEPEPAPEPETAGEPQPEDPQQD